MMKFKSVMMASIMAVIFNSSAYAQLPGWLDGKWLANTVYEIQGDTIKKIEYGTTVNLGEFTINEDSVIVIDGKESNLIVLNDDQALAYKTNPAFKFPKYDNLTLPEKYKWVAGSWTDGELVITFTEKTVTIKQGEYVANSGIYYVDDSGLFDVFWDKNSPDESFIINGDVVAYEGGDNLIKLPEQQKQTGQSEVSDNNPISSLNTSSKPYEGDIKWLYGVWVHNGTEIYITPKYYQARRENDTYLADKDLFELDKIQYVVTEEDNQILGKVIRLDDFYLDPTSKLIYTLSNIDKRLYMEKISNYVSPVISYGKWVLVGLVAIAVLIFIIQFIIKNAYKAIETAKEKIKEMKDSIEKAGKELTIKTKEVKSKVSKLPDNTISFTGNLRNQISQTVSKANSEFLGIGKLLLICLLILFLLDFQLGVLLLFTMLVLFVVKITSNKLFSKTIECTSTLVDKINNKPELWLLLAGIFIFREFNAALGIAIIIMGLFYLFARTESERKQSFYFAFNTIIMDVKNNMAYITFWGLILIIFLLLNYFYVGILNYISVVILLLFIVNYFQPSIFRKVKRQLSELYQKVAQPSPFTKIEKMLNSKTKITVVLLVSLCIVFSAQQASVVNTLPYLLEGGTEFEITNTTAPPAPSSAKDRDSGAKSEVDLAREEIRGLNIQKNILTTKLIGTFDPMQRERISAQISDIDNRIEYLSDYLIQRTGMPF